MGHASWREQVDEVEVRRSVRVRARDRAVDVTEAAIATSRAFGPRRTCWMNASVPSGVTALASAETGT
jgi:hypothetical protein